MTIITSADSWIERFWALVRSGGPKSSLGIIFELIIIKEKPMELQTRCLVFLKGIKPKKTSYKLKTLGFFINCSLHWPMPAFQASAPQPSYCHSTKCLSAARTSYLNYVNSEIRSKPNWIMRAHTGSAMRLRLSELQESDNEARKIRAEKLKNDYKEVDGILHHQGLSFVSEAI